MGAVWLGNDGLWHRDVVLRAIPWAPPSDAEEQESRRERLLNEARALAQLDHPNIVRVLDVAGDDGRPWMVFEAAPYRFPYRPLSDVVRNDGPLRPEQVAQVGLQVLAAVCQAHAVGVLHRGLKPGSILLGPGNRVLLADFGMVTADGSPALTTLEALTGSPPLHGT
jgi:serine/threonine protein kinase